MIRFSGYFNLWRLSPKNNLKRFSGHPLARDPPVLQILRRVSFGTGRKFGADVAKRYGEDSEMLVFLGEKDRKTVQIVKNYGSSKILRIRAPCYLRLFEPPNALCTAKKARVETTPKQHRKRKKSTERGIRIRVFIRTEGSFGHLERAGTCTNRRKPKIFSGSPKRGQRTGVTPILSDFVRFAPILSDFRWGFADPGKQSADFVQFRADFVRFGVFANQTKSARPVRADPFWENQRFSQKTAGKPQILDGPIRANRFADSRELPDSRESFQGQKTP